MTQKEDFAYFKGIDEGWDARSRVGLRAVSHRQVYKLLDDAFATIKDVIDNPEGCWTPAEQLQAAMFVIDRGMSKD